MSSRIDEQMPPYATLPAPQKFQAIQGIILRRLREHPNAICSYSGGSDSDILLDMIERARKLRSSLSEVDYAFFNTGLEMDAIKNHVDEQAQKYSVHIGKYRPKVNIVQASRKYGIPFLSKIVSSGLENARIKNVPISLYYDFKAAEDKKAFRKELKERYPKSAHSLNFICCCTSSGEYRPGVQISIESSAYLADYLIDNPPDFNISARCCDCCKKHLAHNIQKNYDMIITGERRAEGGVRSVPRSDNTALCFTQNSEGKYRFRPLFYVTDNDKEWYRQTYKVKYSDAYELYGLARTGCCGCPISYRAVDDLEMIGKYEPNLKKAAWNVFGKSYEYRMKYNDYKKMKRGKA